jgi:hypothetical protein
MESEFGTKKYIEYLKGDCPLILTSPHGGLIKPSDMDIVSTHRGDAAPRTNLMIQEISDTMFSLIGKRPYVVTNHLFAGYLDANQVRLRKTGSQYDQHKSAWDEWHSFIYKAKADVTEKWGKGQLIDMHGNAHPERWNELGYLLSEVSLNRSDAEIIKRSRYSSIANLAKEFDYLELLRGKTSLGGFMTSRGIKAVPSPNYPKPKKNFFAGGGNTAKHGSKNYKGKINSFQLESSCKNLRYRRDWYSVEFTYALLDFMDTYYKDVWKYERKPVMSDNVSQVAQHNTKCVINKTDGTYLGYIISTNIVECYMKAKTFNNCAKFFISFITRKCYFFTKEAKDEVNNNYMLYDVTQVNETLELTDSVIAVEPEAAEDEEEEEDEEESIPSASVPDSKYQDIENELREFKYDMNKRLENVLLSMDNIDTDGCVCKK